MSPGFVYGKLRIEKSFISHRFSCFPDYASFEPVRKTPAPIMRIRALRAALSRLDVSSLRAPTRAVLLEAEGRLGAQGFPDLDRRRDGSRMAAGSWALLFAKSLNLFLSKGGWGVELLTPVTLFRFTCHMRLKGFFLSCQICNLTNGFPSSPLLPAHPPRPVPVRPPPRPAPLCLSPCPRSCPPGMRCRSQAAAGITRAASGAEAAPEPGHREARHARGRGMPCTSTGTTGSTSTGTTGTGTRRRSDS